MRTAGSAAIAALTIAFVAGAAISQTVTGGVASGALGNGASAETGQELRAQLSAKASSSGVESSGAGGVASGGSAQLFAVVADDSTLVRGKGAFSAAYLATGGYEVLFARDVRACAYIAVLGDPGIGKTPVGTAAVAQSAYHFNGVWVDTKYLDGAPAPLSFYLWVNC